MKLSDALDVVAVGAITLGVHLRFGLWLALIVAGTLVVVSNWIRAK